MAGRFQASHCTINWHGVDDDTPPGYSIAIGTDGLGIIYLWLFKGDAATDETFIGSVSIPEPFTGQVRNAYGRGGGWVGMATDTQATLQRLADQAAAAPTA